MFATVNKEETNVIGQAIKLAIEQRTHEIGVEAANKLMHEIPGIAAKITMDFANQISIETGEEQVLIRIGRRK